MSAPILITADEVNCLVYSYLQDSGFQHSAFAVRMEGRLEHSPHFSKHIPRGELVELLSKALLYVEVESHWKGDAMTANCKTGFSLLEPHVCSTEQKATPNLKPPPLRSISEMPAKAIGSTNGATDASVKRKASTPSTSTDDGRAEKRMRREAEDMEIDHIKPISSSSLTASLSSDASKPTKPTREPGEAEDITNSDAVQLLRGHTSEIFVCAWNKARPGLLATGSKDGIVHIWNVPDPSQNLLGHGSAYTGPPMTTSNFTSTEPCDLTSLDWNPDGTLLAVGSYDSVLRVISPTGELYFSHPQHKGPIFATRFSHSGRWLLTGSLDGTSCIWDVSEKKLHLQYRCHRDCCLDVEWLDDSTFASCGADANIHIMNVHDTKLMKTLRGHRHEVNQIRCNPSQTRLASCSDDTTAIIWNVTDISSQSPDIIPGLVASERVVVLNGHTQSVSCISWCPDLPCGPNELVATCAFDGSTRLWDSVTGVCLKQFRHHSRPTYALSFSPDGSLLSTGGGDGYLHVYDVRAKEKKWSWFAGLDKPGVFELDWQQCGNINRIAMALEGWNAGIVDMSRVPA